MNALSKKVSNILIRKKLTISIAESCTGGLLSSSFTSISGSSKFFRLGLVTYSNASKIKLLKIPNNILIKHGAVSDKVCLLMAKNLIKIYNSNIAISITGIAGPGGGSKEKPVGLVYIGIGKLKKTIVYKCKIKKKSRSYIQKNTVKKALELLLMNIK